MGARVYTLKGQLNGQQPVILLDTHLDENHPDDRAITDQLYGGDATYRLNQEMVLGNGRIRLLRAIGFEVRQDRMNGGHSARCAGVGLWLNTPLPPMEASGTSGMKAAFNGVPNLSVLDGWWLEGCIEGITGWSIGDGQSSSSDGDSGALYDKLEQSVLPLYYQDRNAWFAVMKGAISKNAAFFNSHRMMRRYAPEAYIR